MKNFRTMSRRQSIQYTYKPKSEDYIIISINEIDMKPPKFNRNSHLKDVLYLYFDDMSEPTEGYTTISNQNAIDILNFIDRWQNINNVIIHCTAGISRSVSIRCALEEIYNNKVIGELSKEEKIDDKVVGLKELLDDKNKDDTIYIFNKLCYETVTRVNKFRKLKNKYYDRPDLFVEEFMGVDLLPCQKTMLKELYKASNIKGEI